MILEALLAIYMNREFNIEFLDESLRMPGKRRDNILMRSILCCWPRQKWQRNLGFYALSILKYAFTCVG